MIFDTQKYNGACACGKVHNIAVEKVYIEPDAAYRLEEYANIKDCIVLYDENTYDAAAVHPKAKKEIVLKAKGLHANEKGIQAVLSAALPCSYVVSVGSGTVTDLARYVAANELHVPFISLPTACSMDGYASSTCSMTLNGLKVTKAARPPIGIFADTNVLQHAPKRLSLSGFGDIVGKYIAIADWKLGHLLGTDDMCETILNMQIAAADSVLQNAQSIKQAEQEGAESLMYALILSGLAMQMFGDSRPAAGAEHYISHFLDMNIINEELDSLHGEQVGVGTLMCAKKYAHLAHREFIEQYIPFAWARVEHIFSGIKEQIIEQNTPDVITPRRAQLASESWESISGYIDAIPKYEQLLEVYEEIGAKTSLSDLGLPENMEDTIYKYSPFVRNRITLLRLATAFN